MLRAPLTGGAPNIPNQTWHVWHVWHVLTRQKKGNSQLSRLSLARGSLATGLPARNVRRHDANKILHNTEIPGFFDRDDTNDGHDAKSGNSGHADARPRWPRSERRHLIE